jgi:hypothetical protein
MTPLRQRMLEDLRVRNFSPTTQRAYIYAVARFAQHFGKSPELLGPEDIRAYQLHLLSKQLVWSTFKVSVCALRFLYGVTLGKDWAVRHIPYPRLPHKLPIILSLAELQQFFAAIPNLKHRAALMTAYAAGLACLKSSRSRWPTSTASAWSSASSRVRAAKTAMSCCRPGCLSSCELTGKRYGPRSGYSLATSPTST